MKWTLNILVLVSSFTFFNMASAQQLTSKSTFFVVRLTPHQDLKKELLAFAAKQKMKAGFIASCVGSLEQVNLRFANQSEGKMLKGHFEILSLVGTLTDSSSHLHLAIADSTGIATGGHLLDGNFIYTTAEIVIGELTDLDFKRELDSTYGYQELVVKKRK
jgi:uncharacterized protein